MTTVRDQISIECVTDHRAVTRAALNHTAGGDNIYTQIDELVGRKIVLGGW